MTVTPRSRADEASHDSESALVPADGEVGDATALATPEVAPPTIEAWVIDALSHGLKADFDAWRKGQPDVSVAADWNDDRTLRAEFIVQLCVSTENAARQFPRGIRITGARIAGDIDLVTGSIEALLLLKRCRIVGNVVLRDCTTRLINFAGSRVTGSFNADRIRSSAGVYLRNGFTCDGEVRLSAAVIDGDLDCTGAHILHEGGIALRCDRMRITGSVFLKQFEAKGQVRLLDAKVGANVVLEGATLTHPNEIALLADNARIEGSLVLRDWKQSPVGEISLRNASAAVLQLGAPTEIWPRPRTVRAQGLRYTTLETDGLVSRALCERWLELLVLDPFSPQPYEKCGQVLREIGLADDAKRIAILRRRIQRDLPGVPWWRRFADYLMDRLIGYGYRPNRSVAMLAILAVVGTLVFTLASSEGAMVPSESSVYLSRGYTTSHSLPPGYPAFTPFVYSLDVLLPIIDFQQDSKWRPDIGATARYDVGASPVIVPIGRVAMYYAWLQITLGWALSTLLVASVTGLLRKE
ncbi:MAG: hypothetical protein JWL95_2956 [Gemmatimonadetes bacterium]|nr:hypothetical protein [Gemmatimonadota bacterium]